MQSLEKAAANSQWSLLFAPCLACRGRYVYGDRVYNRLGYIRYVNPRATGSQMAEREQCERVRTNARGGCCCSSAFARARASRPSRQTATCESSSRRRPLTFVTKPSQAIVQQSLKPFHQGKLHACCLLTRVRLLLTAAEWWRCGAVAPPPAAAAAGVVLIILRFCCGGQGRGLRGSIKKGRARD